MPTRPAGAPSPRSAPRRTLPAPISGRSPGPGRRDRGLGRAAALLLAGLGLAAGCGTPPPKLKLSVAGSYVAGATSCGTEQTLGSLQGQVLRLSARVRDATGATRDYCDALLSTSEARTAGFPSLAGGNRVDLTVEVFGGTPGAYTRLASGALLDLDPLAATPFPTLRLFPSSAYACLGSGRLVVPRAFHSATLLDGGQVLLVGGLTASQTGNDQAAAESNGTASFYATGRVELFDPIGGSFTELAAPGVARAFHHATLLSSAAGRHTVLLVGGVTPAADGQVVVTASNTSVGTKPAIRFSIDSLATVAPVEILVVDTSVSPPTATRTTAPAAMQALSTALGGADALTTGGIGGAPLVTTGLVAAGGLTSLNPTDRAWTDKLATSNGQVVQAGALATPRYGAAVVALRDGVGGPTQALLVGGAGENQVAPFERLTLGGASPSGASLDATLPTPGARLPALVMPTVTAMEAPGPSARLLISGGIEVPGATGILNPPAAMTMYQVTYAASGAALAVVPLALSGFGSNATCTRDGDHYRPVAFDAAALLPSGDRVLVNGGAASFGNTCGDCEGEDDISCAVRQSVTVSVPAAATEAPVIAKGTPLSFARLGHTLTVLADGNVLVAGGLARRTVDGQGGTWAVAQAEVYNPDRVVPPASRTVGAATVEVDDPLYPDLVASGVSRAPGLLAGQVSATDAPKKSCPAPKK